MFFGRRPRFRRRRTGARRARRQLRAIQPILIALVLLVIVLAAVIYSNRGGDAALAERLPNASTTRSGVSFRYPADWARNEIEGRAQLANRTEALTSFPPAPGDARIELRVPVPKTLYTDENAPLTEFLTTYAETANLGLSLNEPVEMALGEWPAARADINSEEMDGFAVAIELAPNTVVVALVMTGEHSLEDYEQIALDILNTVEYTPPELPTVVPQ